MHKPTKDTRKNKEDTRESHAQSALNSLQAQLGDEEQKNIKLNNKRQSKTNHHRKQKIQDQKKNNIEKKNDTERHSSQNQSQSSLLLSQPKWYDSSSLPTLPEATGKKTTPITQESIDTLKKRGEIVLNSISEQFAISIQPTSKLKQQQKTSNHGLNRTNNVNLSTYSGLSESDKTFIHRILTDGTSSDKLSALTLLVSSAPLHSRAHLSNLLNLAKKNNREQAGRAIRALVEWLRGAGNLDSGGLPSDRKLKFFCDQPSLPVVANQLLHAKSKSNLGVGPHHRNEFDEWLALWAFEDWFKNWYLDLLRVIESMSHDSLVFTRTQSISHIFNLLNGKPEQEQNLLTLLVNKLGDREKMICSRTSHYLLQMLQVHPRMKSIIVREIASLVLKPIIVQPTTSSGTNANKPADPKNKSSDHQLTILRHHDHARYYGSITLNQIPLSEDDVDVANRLIQVYFELFNDILGKAKIKEEQNQKEHEDSKEKNEEEIEAENLDLSSSSKKKSSQKNHGSKNNCKEKVAESNKKLTKKQILKLKEEEALAEKNSRLVAGILTGLNRALPYATIESAILEGYFETLFRICHTGLFNVSIQALILIQNLLKKSKPSMTDRFYRTLYSTIIDHRLLSSTSKHTLYLNLLFKSVNSDSHLPRTLAFVKRIFQVLPYHQPPFICSTLVLLGHLFATKPNCRQLISRGPASSSPTKEAKADAEGEKEEGEVGVGDIAIEHQEEYDGKKRDPRYAHAENSIIWELAPLLQHYHPSVKLNANQLMKGEQITSTIDLEHHTLTNFLDKFVYRQPKKTQSQKGSAIMQPKLHLRVADVNKVPNNKSSNVGLLDASLGPVNSKAFLERDELQIPADEVFFHKFFKKKEKNEEKKEKKKEKKSKKTEEGDFGGRGGSDDGSSESESESEDEEEVWEAMKQTMDKEMKEDIMDDLSVQDAWSDADPVDYHSDSDDLQLAELLKDEDSNDEDEVEFSNQEIDVLSDLDDGGGDDPVHHFSEDESDLPSVNKRKKSSGNDKDKKRRKIFKDMPTFASVDQFSHLLSNDDDNA